MNRKRIYLAGKVSKDCWRHPIVDGFMSANMEIGYDSDFACCGPIAVRRWPVLIGAVGGVFDYVGPFFVSCDHGCGHRIGPHGSAAVDLHDLHSDADHRKVVAEHCLQSIHKADVVAAWISASDCHGTLVEIGYAKALGKNVHIGYASEALANDVWFAGHSTDWNNVDVYDNPTSFIDTVVDIETRLSTSLCESPIEVAFWEKAAKNLLGFRPQVEVTSAGCQYRLDFANESRRLAIELDGFKYHNTPEAFERDTRRQRALEADGWRFLRFTGREITNNVGYCVAEAVAWATQMPHA